MAQPETVPNMGRLLTIIDRLKTQQTMFNQ